MASAGCAWSRRRCIVTKAVRPPLAPGRVVVSRAASGDTVQAGQEVMVIEAMKMELSLKAPRDGTVAEVRAQAGDFVEADAVLVVLEDA